MALGFILGMRHSTDADHVVAIMTIVTRQRSIKPATWVGILWGLGHSFTIFVVGVAIILFNVVIPPRIGLTMELAVAVMLILLGVLNLTGLMRWVTERVTPSSVIHSHVHRHGELIHAHPHLHLGAHYEHHHENARLSRFSLMMKRLGLYHIVRPFVIGIVHGLAGSAAIALLVLATIHDASWGVVYLVIFGVGTIVGMMLITTAMAASFVYTGSRFARLDRHLATIAGIISFGFGCFLVVQIGFVEGLFTSAPHWVPH